MIPLHHEHKVEGGNRTHLYRICNPTPDHSDPRHSDRERNRTSNLQVRSLALIRLSFAVSTPGWI